MGYKFLNTINYELTCRLKSKTACEFIHAVNRKNFRRIIWKIFDFRYCRRRTWHVIQLQFMQQISGNKVVLFEKEHIGGVCLNKGCIPTKSILHASEVYSNIKIVKAAEFPLMKLHLIIQKF